MLLRGYVKDPIHPATTYKDTDMKTDFILVDLGRAKKETKFNWWLHPADTLTEWRF